VAVKAIELPVRRSQRLPQRKAVAGQSKWVFRPISRRGANPPSPFPRLLLTAECWLTSNASEAHPWQLRNRLNGQCLATTNGAEVYAGPLSGSQHTAILLNRGYAARVRDYKARVRGEGTRLQGK
jgi:hypothetical protein